MLAPWYAALPVVLFPLVTEVTRRRSAWLFAAAAAGFGLLALADWFAVTGRLDSLARSDPYFQDNYYVVVHLEYGLFVTGVFCALAMVQWLKQRLDREDPRWTRGLFWILLLSIIGSRLVEMLAIPFAMPRRYLDYPADLRVLMETGRILHLVSVAAFLGQIGLMVVAPLWRLAVGRRGGHR